MIVYRIKSLSLMKHSLNPCLSRLVKTGHFSPLFRVIIPALFLAFSINLFSQTNHEIRKLGTEEIEDLLENDSDKLHVINFWATWCGPCVTELPYFEKIASELKHENIEFLLVSLDFPSQVDSRLIPFLQEKNISLDVGLITELDYDLWISKVDQEWKGNLPATLIFNNAKNKRSFTAGAVEEDELRELILKNL